MIAARPTHADLPDADVPFASDRGRRYVALVYPATTDPAWHRPVTLFRRPIGGAREDLAYVGAAVVTMKGVRLLDGSRDLEPLLRKALRAFLHTGGDRS